MAHLLRLFVGSGVLRKGSSTLCQNFRICPPAVISLPTLNLLNNQQIRSTSFFNKLPAERLWKGVTSVSNAGRKRGRGKGSGKKIARNLNRGQIIGVGKANIVWPGLTVPVLRGRELVERQKLPEDPQRAAKLLALRNQMGTFRRLRLSPLERGWSGPKMPGRSIGPPEPIGEDMFEGFDTKVLEMKSVFNMTGNMGRKRRVSAFVVTGNGQGLAGFGLGKAIDGQVALKSAKNRAGQKLMFIQRYKDHTVCHDFYSQFGKTKLFVKKKPEGYGLVCHRAIRTMCEIIGIKDMYAKVEGSTNLQHIVKAFFLGLLQQKTPEQLANEVGLHLVEFRKERDNFPELIASPDQVNEDVTETPDFSQYVMGERVVLQRKKFPPFFKLSKGWEFHLKKTLRYRNEEQVRLQLKTHFGGVKSMYSDEYPEANIDYGIKLKKESSNT